MSGLPPGLLLFDTGIYIRFSRQECYLWLGEDGRIFQRTILTAVVAAELYAGARDTREKRALDQLCHAHLTPYSKPLIPFSLHMDRDRYSCVSRARRTLGQMDFVGHFRDLLITLEATRADEGDGHAFPLHTDKMTCLFRGRPAVILRSWWPIVNPNSNPRCVQLLGIIKYLAVPNSLVSCCEYLISPR